MKITLNKDYSMKKILFTLMLAVVATVASAKDIKTVIFTTMPQMHCENCENKIKGNLKFEKGVKKIETSVEKQKVYVTYDADKTSVEKLQKGFEKFGYTARVTDEKEKIEASGEACTNM